MGGGDSGHAGPSDGTVDLHARWPGPGLGGRQVLCTHPPGSCRADAGQLPPRASPLLGRTLGTSCAPWALRTPPRSPSLPTVTSCGYVGLARHSAVLQREWTGPRLAKAPSPGFMDSFSAVPAKKPQGTEPLPRRLLEISGVRFTSGSATHPGCVCDSAVSLAVRFRADGPAARAQEPESPRPPAAPGLRPRPPSRSGPQGDHGDSRSPGARHSLPAQNGPGHPPPPAILHKSWGRLGRGVSLPCLPPTDTRPLHAPCVGSADPGVP